MVMGSAVAVVYTKHQARQLFAALSKLTRERDELDTEWGRLQLEQSTWSMHKRIDRIARQQLNMKLPSDDTTVIVMVPQQ
jgi:cell division protein FtsL